ncbi:MAG: HlyC/CorC family transporter [Chloroflexi bacterium]|nr:HlyC/CorC family transporter [Chloroflexota bacterium]
MPESKAFLYLGLLALCLLLSAFFSSSEVAFISLQKFRLRHLVEKKVPRASRVARLAEHPERLLPIILLGNTLVNTAIASIATIVAVSLLKSEQTAIIASTAGATVLVLVLGETVPKMVAARQPERLALFFVPVVEALERLLWPLAVLLQWLAGRLARSLGGGDTRAAITEEEIKTLILVGRESGAVEHHEAVMMEKVLEATDRPVREVMVPRTESVFLEKGTSLKEFFDLYRGKPYSRYPVFEGTLDNVVGVLSVGDILRGLADGLLQGGDDVTKLAQPALFTPETKAAGDLMVELRETQHRMVVVVDEFGGVAGLVTLRQLTEEIVGRIKEGAHEVPEVVRIAPTTYQVAGGMSVEEVNEQLGLRIPEGEDYDTLAGFILHSLGRVPTVGQQLTMDSLRLVVSAMRGVKIERVMLIKGPHAPPDRKQWSPE